MGIRELKSKIENKTPIKDFLIFRLPEDKNYFLINQYIEAISNISGKEIVYIENYEDLGGSNLFGEQSSFLQVCLVDELNLVDESFKNIYNLIIVASKIGVKTESIFNDYIVNFPKLEEWQIKDYVETKLQGVKQSNIDILFNIYKNNIYKLNNEILKINIFDEKIRNYIFENLNISNNYDIFNLINGLIRKDKLLVSNSLKVLGEVEPMSFLALLYNNLKNVINIQLNPKATAQSLNMNPRQFSAIKYSTGYYSKESLINIFEIVTSIDYKLKNGELPSNMIVDYIIVNMLSR